MTLPRLLHAASVYHLAIWGVVLTTASCAVAQPVAQRYMLQSAPIYTMLPGPEEVVWCAGRDIPSVRQLDAGLGNKELLQRTPICAASSGERLMEVTLPLARDTGGFTLGMTGAGRVYYADALPVRNKRPLIKVYSYLTPDELSALMATPGPLLTVRPEDMGDPMTLYRRLNNCKLGTHAYKRAPDLAEELYELSRPFMPPEHINEPWNVGTPDQEAFTKRLVAYLNKIIGDETEAESLYHRLTYALTRLPSQIVKVMEQIDKLGGAYCGDPPENPWQALDAGGGTPGQTTVPNTSPAVIEKIRLLNRMLLEYELGGALKGTMYHTVSQLEDYQPCQAQMLAERWGQRTLLVMLQPETCQVMPMAIDAAGTVRLLLDYAPDQTATSTKAKPGRSYLVGPAGKLTGPLPSVGRDDLYVVQGEDVRWVEIGRDE